MSLQLDVEPLYLDAHILSFVVVDLKSIVITILMTMMTIISAKDAPNGLNNKMRSRKNSKTRLRERMHEENASGY